MATCPKCGSDDGVTLFAIGSTGVLRCVPCNWRVVGEIVGDQAYLIPFRETEPILALTGGA